MNHMRFLLIEDEPSAVELTKLLLGEFASRIDDSPTLEGAFALLAERCYDIVILDLRLSGSEREETIAAIPRIKRASGAPVIVATGWTEPNMKQRCLAAGADAFVSKTELTTGILMAVQVALQSAPEKVREPSFPEHVALLERVLKHA